MPAEQNLALDWLATLFQLAEMWVKFFTTDQRCQLEQNSARRAEFSRFFGLEQKAEQKPSNPGKKQNFTFFSRKAEKKADFSQREHFYQSF